MKNSSTSWEKTVETALDDANTWFLHGVFHTGFLDVIVAEGIRDAEKQNPDCIGHRVQVRSNSRYFKIRFDEVLAWQGINERYTAWDDYEMRDTKGFVQVLQRSRFVDYLKQFHGWLFEVENNACHYRIFTEDDVIDVVAKAAPVIEPWSN